MSRVCVVHLARAENGIEPFARFLESYACAHALPDQELAIVFKGFDAHPELLEAHRQLLAGRAYRSLAVADTGLDIGPYFFAARHLDAEYVCFLNSFSVIKDANWMAKMLCAVQTPGAGIVSATASLSSLADHLRDSKAETMQMSHYASRLGPLRYAVGAYRYRRWFAPFPNPHLRSNAFLIRRDVFLRLKHRPIVGKTDAYRFESGVDSMTRQIQGMGLRPLVVGQDGRGYEIPEWRSSNTFMQGNQNNLLVEDNQTRAYQQADAAAKQQYALRAWGPNALFADDTRSV